jgi:tetratricopeptide (TPR) repeat protein
MVQGRDSVKLSTTVKIAVILTLAWFGLGVLALLPAYPLALWRGFGFAGYLADSGTFNFDCFSFLFNPVQLYWASLAFGACLVISALGALKFNNQARRFLRALLLVQILWMLGDVFIAWKGIGPSFILSFFFTVALYYFFGLSMVKRLYLKETAVIPEEKPKPSLFKEPFRFLAAHWKKFAVTLAFIGLLGGLLSFPMLAIPLVIHLSDVPLRMPWKYKPIARRLAVLCQTYPLGLPDGIGATRISATGANIFYGGGFYHYGYTLDLDEAASTPQTNVWRIGITREDMRKDDWLWSLSLPATQTLSPDEINKILESGLKQAIQGDYYESVQFCEKAVQYYLKAGRSDRATSICQEWVAAQPAGWRPRLMLAHVQSKLGKADQAAADLAQWVNSRTNFAYYVVLAHFEYSEGRNNKAVAALRKAAEMPFTDYDKTLQGVKDEFGVKGAHLALACGDFELCRRMCDKYLPVKHDKWDWYPLLPLWRHRAAADLMLGNKRGALDSLDKADSLIGDVGNAEELHRKNNALRAAINEGDLSYMRDPGNFSDTNYVWNDPFFKNY